MKKAGRKILIVLAVLLATGIYYYITLPAFNIFIIGTGSLCA